MLDPTAGVRAYVRGNNLTRFWVGFYNAKAIDHFTGAPVGERRVESDDDATQRERFLGSPTPRVNGVDIEPATAGAAHRATSGCSTPCRP